MQFRYRNESPAMLADVHPFAGGGPNKRNPKRETMSNETLQHLADRVEIQDCLLRYARGVDRGDWGLVRSTYHPDARVA